MYRRVCNIGVARAKLDTIEDVMALLPLALRRWSVEGKAFPSVSSRYRNVVCGRMLPSSVDCGMPRPVSGSLYIPRHHQPSWRLRVIMQILLIPFENVPFRMV